MEKMRLQRLKPRRFLVLYGTAEAVPPFEKQIPGGG